MSETEEDYKAEFEEYLSKSAECYTYKTEVIDEDKQPVNYVHKFLLRPVWIVGDIEKGKAVAEAFYNFLQQARAISEEFQFENWQAGLFEAEIIGADIRYEVRWAITKLYRVIAISVPSDIGQLKMEIWNTLAREYDIYLESHLKAQAARREAWRSLRRHYRDYLQFMRQLKSVPENYLDPKTQANMANAKRAGNLEREALRQLEKKYLVPNWIKLLPIYLTPFEMDAFPIPEEAYKIILAGARASEAKSKHQAKTTKLKTTQYPIFNNKKWKDLSFQCYGDHSIKIRTDVDSKIFNFSTMGFGKKGRYNEPEPTKAWDILRRLIQGEILSFQSPPDGMGESALKKEIHLINDILMKFSGISEKPIKHRKDPDYHIPAADKRNLEIKNPQRPKRRYVPEFKNIEKVLESQDE